MADTKELRDFGIQILTVGFLDAKQAKRLSELIGNVCEQNEGFEEALERIQRWSQAYPLKAFPKPDLKKARQVLKAADMTLDAISADAMRHVIDGVKDITKQALNGVTDGKDIHTKSRR